MFNNIVQNNSPNIISTILNKYIAQKRLEQDVGDFLRTKTRSTKLYSNDLRHQYASAVVAQKYGNTIAELLGNAQEFFSNSGEKDTAIDQYNNKIGRQYAKKYPNFTKQQYLETLYNDHSKLKQKRKEQLGF